MSTITKPNRSFAPNRERLFRPRQIGKLLTHVILLCLGFAYTFPFLWMLGSSFKTAGGFFEEGLSIIPREWHPENFVEAWVAAKFGTYFANTVFISVATVILTVLFTSMAGFVLARTQMPGKKVIIGGVLILMFMPSGYTIIPTYEIILWLGLNNTLWATIVVETAGGMVFNTFLFMGYYNTIHKEIEEAAIIDGASFPRLYWNVMLPLAGPMIATVTLLTFMNSWNNFFIPLVFSLGNPELRTLGVGMYALVGEFSRDWTLICAGAVIALLPIMLVFVFLQRYFVEAIAGAVK